MSDYQTYSGYGKQFASQYGIPWPIFAGLIQQESGWNAWPTGYNDGGQAVGFGQLHAGAAKDVGVNRYDPIQNLKGAAAYLSQQYKATGNWTDALAAYNEGIGNYKTNKGQKYAANVFAQAKKFGDVTSDQLSVNPNNAGKTGDIGTGGMTGGEYTDQQKQNAANNVGGAVGSVFEAFGNFWNNGPGKAFTPGLADAAAGAGALAGGVAGSTAEGAQQATQAVQSILPSNLSSLVDAINSMFTAEFWKTASPYIIVAVAAVGFILFGGLTMARRAAA